MQNRSVSAITAAFKLVVIEPSGFDECPKLVDSLKAKKPIIINLEKIETDTARKIFDFLSGATYALNGNVQKVANNIFVFAPENVDITAGNDNKGIFENDKKKNPWK
jgi:cell division inhibitor SepF